MMGRETIRLSDMQSFTNILFDKPKEAKKAAIICKAILDAQSSRISDLSRVMKGNIEANYKEIQRFLDDNEPIKALNRLYMEQAPYIIADPTDIERPQAKKTGYVGKLKSGKNGFQILPLDYPHKGRAVPFHFIDYSSRTIENEASSRNLEHNRAIRGLKELIGDKPLVMDREFSYEELLSDFIKEKMKFVIRLNTGNGVNLYDEDGEKVTPIISKGESILRRNIFYKNGKRQVKVNLAGEWGKGFKEPLLVMTNLEPEKALSIYKDRMKIEESFRDLKNLLGLDKIMNKSRVKMRKMVALVMLACAIGLLIGEKIREHLYTGKKSELYSGLFILLKLKLHLARELVEDAINRAFALFRSIVYGYVRTNV